MTFSRWSLESNLAGYLSKVPFHSETETLIDIDIDPRLQDSVILSRASLTIPFSSYLYQYCSFAGIQAADKHTLVLVRHGESTWNLENKFTGWYDCPLSPKGHEEVTEAGQLIAKEGIKLDVAHVSLLQRAIQSLNHVLEKTGFLYIPVHKTWLLNERHYGCK